MGMKFTYLLFILGLIMIMKGGDWFVDASIWMARRTGISLVVIAATVISIATTLPEFFVSTIASAEGLSDMAIGNSVGSIICNIALVLGICALIKPITIRGGFFGLKGILMLAYLCILFILASDGIITRLEGIFLISLSIIFFVINILENKGSFSKNHRKDREYIKKGESALNLFKFIIGGFLIISGADFLVETAADMANFFRIPKQIISLTLLALGTSLPELTTSISATLKNQQDISIGNILGACILNITFVIGGSALVSNNGLLISRQTLSLDIPMAILFSLIFITSGIFSEKISRFTGFILVFLYGIYITILF